MTTSLGRTREHLEGSSVVSLSLCGLLRYPSDDAVLQYLREGWFEYQELVFVSRLLRQGDIFVDIGAHCGLYSALASKYLGPNATIVSVEPNPDLHPFLRNNVGFAREVVDEAIGAGGRTLARAAVYTGDAVLTLKRPKAGRSAYASLSADFADDGFVFDEVDVHTRPLGSLIPDADSGAVTLIKLDTEGAEPAILAQGLPSLPTDRPLVIMIEFDEGSLRRSGTSSEALAGGILDAGYELYRYDAISNTIHRFEGPYPLWGQNLFATRHADVIGARLNSVPADVFDQTQEFLERGRAADRLYKRSEQFDRLIGAIESLTDQAHGEWAKTEGTDEAGRTPLGPGALSPAATATMAVEQANDEFGRLVSSLNWIRAEVASKNAMVVTLEDAVGARDRQIGALVDHARGLLHRLGQEVAAIEKGISPQDIDIPLADVGSAEAINQLMRALDDEVGKLSSILEWLRGAMSSRNDEITTLQKTLRDSEARVEQLSVTDQSRRKTVLEHLRLLETADSADLDPPKMVESAEGDDAWAALFNEFSRIITHSATVIRESGSSRDMINQLEGELRMNINALDALSSQVSTMKSDIGLAREDLAVVIRALSEMKRAGTEVPGLGATPVDTAIELAHRVKANLARAAQITEVVRQHAPDAPPRPVLDTGSANTVELQNTIRRLTGELRHVNSLATELANSSWMKLGGRVGARAFTVLKSIVAVSHASLSAKPMATADTMKPDQTQG